MSERLDKAERMFANIIKEIDPDDVTKFIEKDIDLVEEIRERAPGMVAVFRRLARSYVRKHPNHRRRAKEDPDDSIKRILSAVADLKPEVAKRFLEGPPRYTAEELGLVSGFDNLLRSPPSTPVNPVPKSRYPELGLDYARRNFEKVLILLGI